MLGELWPDAVDLVGPSPCQLRGPNLCGDGQFDAQEGLERFGEFAGDVVVIVDEDSLEDGLVELTPHGRARGVVGTLPVRGEAESAGEVSLHCFERDVDGSQTLFSGGKFVGDSVLFSLEQIEWYGVGVVSVEELLALVAQGADAPSLEVAFGIGVCSLTVQLVKDEVTQVVEQRLGGLDGGVVLGHEGLGLFDADGRLGAVGALLLPARADEVRVDATVATFGVAYDEARVASAAVDAALEVVVMSPLLLARTTLLRE